LLKALVIVTETLLTNVALVVDQVSLLAIVIVLETY
jgi:hypothetical protein